MTVEPSTAPDLRIPEPHEVIDWLRAQWRALRAYIAVAEHQVLIAVLLVGTLLRLGFVDLIPIRDETVALLVRVADGAAHSIGAGLAPTEGVDAGVLAGIYRVLTLISRDPRWLVAVQSLVEMAALALFYNLVRRGLGHTVAMLALTVVAVNPWCVYAVRTLTAEAWYVPLAVLMLVGLDMGLERRRIEGWLILSLSLATLIYLQPSNLTLLLVLAALVALYRNRMTWSHLLLSVLLGLVYLLPGFWLRNQVRFFAVVSWVKEWAHTLISPESFGGTLRQMQSLIAGRDLGSLAAPEAISWGLAEYLLGLNTMVAWLSAIALPVAAWVALRAWGRWRESDQSTLAVVSCVWLVVGLVTVWPGEHTGVFSGAAMLMMPAAAIAMGLTVDRLLALPNKPQISLHWWSQPLRLVIALLLLAVVGWQAYQTLHLDSHVGQHDVSDAYGVPYRYWRRTANLIQREAEAEDLDRVWLLAGKDPGMLGQAPDMMRYLLRGDVHVVICGSDAIEGVLLPAAQPGLYLTTGATPMAERAISLLGAEDRGLVVYPNQSSRARIQYLAERPVADLLAPIEQRGLWVFDAGIKLLGCDWPSPLAPGQTLQVANYWTFGDVPSADLEMEHVAFCRLLDAQGSIVAEASGMALQVANWQPGLMLKQWWQMELPAAEIPQELYLQIGVFRPEDGYRNLHLDAQGYPLGEAVLIGPLDSGY